MACRVALCGACIVFALDGDNISCLISIVNSVFDIFSCFFSMVNFVYISVLFCTIRGICWGTPGGLLGRYMYRVSAADTAQQEKDENILCFILT